MNENGWVLRGRDDVWFKTPLARDLLLDRTTEISRTLYFEHLFHWNYFFEEQPRKVGPNDFLKSFESLASSARAKGSIVEPVLLSRDGTLANGSHRSALHLSSKMIGRHLPLQAVGSQWESTNYSFSFFLHRGVNEHAVALAATEKILHDELNELSLIVIWPVAQGDRDNILAEFSAQTEANPLIIDFELSSPGLINLVRLVYEDHDWASRPQGVASKALSEATTFDRQRVTVMLLDGVARSEILRLKQSLRSRWNNSPSQGIHSTDNQFETLRVWTSVSTPRSVSAFEVCEPRQFISYSEKMRETYGLIDCDIRRLLGTAVSGSQWLEIFGIRRSHDLDMLVDSSVAAFEYPNNHNSYVEGFGIHANDLIYEPDGHVWFQGRKFISPWVYLDIISERREPKDLASISRLQSRIAKWDAVARSIPWTLSSASRNKEVFRHREASISAVSPWGQSERLQKLTYGQTKPVGLGNSAGGRSGINAVAVDFGWRSYVFLRRLKHRLLAAAKLTLRLSRLPPLNGKHREDGFV